MKVFLLLLLSLSASVSAFAPRTFVLPRRLGGVVSKGLSSVSSSSSTSAASRPDVTQAVADAVNAAKRYGAASPEARLAWETVEELSASDNR
jgi:hypothetical protein